MRRLRLPLVGLVALIVGSQVGWRFVVGPLIAWAFIAWAFASLRSMASGGTPAAAEGSNEPRPVADDERVLYWCAECGTELLLVIRGSGVIPRHCGGKMHERAELLGSN